MKTIMPNAKSFPFRMGADPEFNFVVQNRHTARLRADNLMRDFFHDKRAGNGGYEIEGGNAGWDGNSATGEIRPKAEFSPKALKDNIGLLYREICKRSPQAIKVSVRSDTAPVGGHIHFELDDISKNMSEQKMKIIQKRMSTFYMPIALGEDPANIALRIQTSYGKFNDCRRENGKTFEYRTPSAEWQITPKICEATLAYLGTVWFEAIHRPESFKNWDTVYPNDRAGNSIQELLIAGYGPLKRAVVGDIKKVIKGFEYYPMFKEEIEYILNYEKVYKDKKEAMFCVNIGWDLQKRISPTKKMINNESQIRKNLGNIDIDHWLDLLKIPYNSDLNVKDFVDALKKRILAFDWNLSNEYFMFGMRKGIKEPIVMNANRQMLLGQAQIKTIRDKASIMETFQRMAEKLMQNSRLAKPSTKLIGIPYEARMSKDIKPLIELIYSMEKEPQFYLPKDMKTEELLDDRMSNDPNAWGDIARAYSRPEAEVVMEENSGHRRDSSLNALLENDEVPETFDYDSSEDDGCDEDENGSEQEDNKHALVLTPSMVEEAEKMLAIIRKFAN